MKKVILYFFLLLLTGCQFGELYYVDFTDPNLIHSGMFRVITQKTTDLQQLVLDSTQLALWRLNNTQEVDNAVSYVQGAQRASSTTVNNVAQQLLDFSKMTTAIELSGVYESVDVDNNPILLSGKVILPAKSPIKRYILKYGALYRP